MREAVVPEGGREGKQVAGENYVTRCFVICTPRQIVWWAAHVARMVKKRHSYSCGGKG